MTKRKSEYKCIFCLSKDQSFTKIEHIIPESLGGDEILPKGIMCDKCNLYFGTEVENKAITSSPLAFARSLMCVPSKRKKHNPVKGFRFEIVGSDEGMPLVEMHPEKIKATFKNEWGTLIVPIDSMDSLVRLLLKMGLEFVASSKKLNLYSPIFDDARKAARCPKKGSVWKIAETSMSPKDVWESGKDKQGYYEKRKIYQYSLGVCEPDQICFYFQYWVHCFFIPLTVGDFESTVKTLNQSNPDIQPFQIKSITLA